MTLITLKMYRDTFLFVFGESRDAVSVICCNYEQGDHELVLAMSLKDREK